MKSKLRLIIEAVFFSLLGLLFAFYFSVQVPPYIGVIVFVSFFTYSVTVIVKLMQDLKKYKDR